MKSEILRVSVALLLIGVTGFVWAGEVSAEADEAGGEIVSLSGSVEVLLAGDEEYQDAAPDMFLQAQDKVKTGVDSYVEVAFDDEGGNIVRVDADTSATFLFEEREKIELLQGEIFSTISNLAEDETFEIKTPTAVAGIRGTDWVTRVDEEGTDVETLDGSLYVKGVDKDGRLMAEETVVQPGYKTRIRRYQAPAKPDRLSQTRQKRLRTLKSGVRGRAQNTIRKRKLYPGLQKRHDRMKKSHEQYRKPLLDKKKKPGTPQGGPDAKPGRPGSKPGKPGTQPKKEGAKSSDHKPKYIPSQRPSGGGAKGLRR